MSEANKYWILVKCNKLLYFTEFYLFSEPQKLKKKPPNQPANQTTKQNPPRSSSVGKGKRLFERKTQHGCAVDFVVAVVVRNCLTKWTEL